MKTPFSACACCLIVHLEFDHKIQHDILYQRFVELTGKALA